MHQLIYTSEARPDLSSEDLFRIIEQSARNNPSADITGFLLYRKNKFLQLIEGPLLSLETLISKLENDTRHHSLRILQRLPVAKRSFPRWRMQRIGWEESALDELERALVEAGQPRSVPSAVREFLNAQMAV